MLHELEPDAMSPEHLVILSDAAHSRTMAQVPQRPNSRASDGPDGCQPFSVTLSPFTAVTAFLAQLPLDPFLRISTVRRQGY